ncbi:MAG: DUF4907 domain-containing protein [Bacteroidota bacterium]|nr:DUF4907 domain-containing protein [Bacteroidota bacterium]
MKITEIVPPNKATALLALIFLISSIYFFSKASEQEQGEKQNKKIYKVETFQTATGWGYKIFNSEKILINQENIPAVSGIKSFKSEDEAMITANLAVKKIKNGFFPPTITISELDSLKINY